MRYYDDEPPSGACDECFDRYARTKSTHYWLNALIEQLFGSDKIDPTLIMDYLDELCSQVGMSLPKGEVTVERKLNTKITPIMESINEWTKFNREYLRTHKL